MFGIFDGAVNGWRNASLDSAVYSVDIEIGDRSNWLFPAISPRIGKFINDIVMRPASAAVGLFTRPEPKEPPAMPELPVAFRDNALGENLKKTYEQRTRAVIASAESTKAMLNLDFTAMRQQEAIQTHQAALDRVSLPENTAKTAAVSAAGGTLLGGLVANIPDSVKKDLADGLVKKAQSILS